MASTARGADIKRRRLALGITSLRQFEEAMGGKPGRGTLGDVEDGTAADRTYDVVESWLARQEEENGLDAASPQPAEVAPQHAEPIKLTMRGVYGVAEIIVEGPVDRPEELAAAVDLLLDRLSKREGMGDGSS